MKRGSRWSLLLFVPLCLLLLGDRPAAPTTPVVLAPDVRLVRLPAAARHHGPWAPRVRHANSKSANWAGYAVQTDLGRPQKRSVTNVQGTWQVPPVAASDSTNTASAIWIGLDGNSNRTVEQIGTEQDWESGAPLYYAWFEMYPARGYLLKNFPVVPGDQISAQVQFIGKNKFNLSITNVTRGVYFSIVKKRNAKRTSAEWIVEAPAARHILPLANFQTTTFSNCLATLNGHTGPINDPAWQHESLTMESAPSVIAAEPSTLTPDGMSFSVTWYHQ